MKGKENMERDIIESKVYELICEIIEMPEDEIEEEHALMDDLDISSMEIMTMIADLEEYFHITIPENAMRELATVGDIIDYIYEVKRS